MQIGAARSDSLRALGERSKLAELKNFTTSMVQADAFGIPIGRVLRVQANEMRTKRRQRAEEMAQKVPVKILFPLIFCILPVLFIAVMGPGVLVMMSAFSDTGMCRATRRKDACSDNPDIRNLQRSVTSRLHLAMP